MSSYRISHSVPPQPGDTKPLRGLCAGQCGSPEGRDCSMRLARGLRARWITPDRPLLLSGSVFGGRCLVFPCHGSAVPRQGWEGGAWRWATAPQNAFNGRIPGFVLGFFGTFPDYPVALTMLMGFGVSLGFVGFQLTWDFPCWSIPRLLQPCSSPSPHGHILQG